MRTIAIAALIIAIVLVVFGLLLEALFWLFVIGLALLVVAVIAGWIGMRRASSMTRDDTSG
jgi:lysylphosphatidylglycerol synthetase-like protein (DUF2156 family)